EESGRTYQAHGEGEYFLSSNSSEQNLPDFQHASCYMMMDNSPACAVIGDSPRQVLDIGCGAGTWALGFAETHPSPNAIDTDLNLVQPDAKFPNCSFLQDDVEDEWILQVKFDYIPSTSNAGSHVAW
ncbi:uncharacterized protein BCR38DRAFT_336374, partial [Pseudomassariella vexata]